MKLVEEKSAKSKGMLEKALKKSCKGIREKILHSEYEYNIYKRMDINWKIAKKDTIFGVLEIVQYSIHENHITIFGDSVQIISFGWEKKKREGERVK